MVKKDEVQKPKRKQFSLDVSDLENFVYDMSRCVKCKGCKWVDHIFIEGINYSIRCPSSLWKPYDAYGAFGKMRIGIALYEKRLEWTEKLLEILYACTLCGACDVGCKRNLDLEIGLALESLRIKAVREGAAPLPAHREVISNVLKTHNRFGLKNEGRENLQASLRFKKDRSILYFVGCLSSFHEFHIPEALCKVLMESGWGFEFLDEEWCCGNVIYSLGMIEEAKKIAERNVELIRSKKANVLLVSCAECYRMWKVDYPKILGLSTDELGFRVTHFIELAFDLLKEGYFRPRRKIERKVAYHDSCSVSRLCDPWVKWSGTRGWMGITDPPIKRRRGIFGLYLQARTILSSIPGLKLVELPRTRENALCCGAGRGTKEAFPEFSDFVVKERIKEVKDSGAEMLVSSCPWCKIHFRGALSDGGIDVLDISEVLALSL